TDLYVSGPVSSLSIQTPNMRALNNSVFTFNANSTSTVEEFKMLQFLKEEKDGSVRRVEQKTSANMRVNFNVFVDEGTSVNVLVGDDIGNISVRGKAERLNFQMQRNGGISMDGGFTVGHGTFTSKAVLNKTFQIVKGSNISWSGNPMTPTLDITANYMRTVANTGEYLGIGSIPPINLVLQTKITQSLINPKIELDVVADEVSSQIKETLNAKLNQNDEKLLQFGSILLLNRFNTSDASTSVVNIAQNTGYDLLFKQLGSVLNTISNEFQIDLNYVRGDASSNMGDRASAGVSLDISPRITLKTGFGIPLTRGTEYTTNNFLSGEGTLEYDASKQNDGSLVLRAYSKPMNIGMNGTGVIGNMNQAYGVGIVHTRSFDSLFKRKNKKKATEKINDTVENTDK
ncbi:translocation/assembly module TamB domain-containing protein, partial [Bergeyella zoohelcum]|uniref:translocation/assembly module TamB domain-containing protein n=1 Tax=Bergeyella zoohelcum TaxID=1015 RepID=UPI003736C979